MVKMAITMLKTNFKSAISLIINLAMTIMMCLIMINLLESRQFKILYLTVDQDATDLRILYFLIIAICVYLVAYSCQYYINVNSREIALVKLAGYNTFDLIKYMSVQNFIIVTIAYGLSMILSMLLIPLFQYLIYYYNQINADVFVIAPGALFQSLMILLMMYVLIVFLDLYFSNQVKISDMLEGHNIAIYKNENKKFKLPDLLYILIYLLGLSIIYQSTEINFGTGVAIIIGAIGGYGLFNQTIFNYLQKRNNCKRLKALTYVVNGNVSLFLKKIKVILVLMMFVMVMLPIKLINVVDNSLYFIQLQLIYLLIVIIICSTLYNRCKIDFTTKKQLYQNLYKLGLTYRDIKQVLFKEIIIVFSILFIIAGGYLFSILIKFNHGANLNLWIMAEYVIPLLGCLMLILFKRKREIDLWKK
ncbi:FtsX-like permease family protein [uncultured Thomasclavelia sp.]|uniref:FtsX-like permease family protein n=1 Tax=uncultured Thomasclavelia sp. TaxID=3025759 RepID=UPI0025D1D9D4|nr:FtsX-like permease family protein [uncultured Thomasclavelia sp.]